MKTHFAILPTRVQTWRGTYAIVWLQEYHEQYGNKYCLRLNCLAYEED